MTASPSIDPQELLHEQLAQASPDLMREMLQMLVWLGGGRDPTPDWCPAGLPME